MILSAKALLMFFLFTVFPIANLLLAEAIIELREDAHKYLLGMQVEFLEDRKGTLILDEVRSLTYANKFQASTKEVPNFGYTKSVYWIRFTVKNPLTYQKKLFLVLNHPFMKQINLYYANQHSAFAQKSAGLVINPDIADLKNRNHLFEIEFSPQSETTVYMRFVNDGPMGLPLLLYEPHVLAHQDNIEHLVLGGFYGILLGLLIYTFFIFLTFKNRSYLLYLLFLSVISVYQLSVDGFGYQYLWRANEWMRLNSAIICWNLSIATYLAFSRSFLNAPKNTPKLDAILLVVIGLSILNALYSQIGDGIFTIKSTAFLQSFATLLALTIAGFCFIKRERSAYFYSGAMLFLLSGTSLTLLKNAGILPSNLLTVWGIHLGIAAELLLLAIGLADRINTIKKERSQAIQNQERAEQLRLSAEAESAAQSEYLSLVSHELRIPMQGILGFAKLGVHRFDSLNDGKKRQYFQEIHHNGLKLLNLLNNLLDLSRFKSSKVEFNFQPVKLSEISNDIMGELKAMIKEKELRVISKTPVIDDTATIDREKIEHVIRNLLSNAIKFSDEQGEISVEILSKGSSLLLRITDEGIGIRQGELEAIFEPFVQGSQNRIGSGGTGLGLTISKRIIDAHNGKIWAENRKEGGAIFSFQIPVEPTLQKPQKQPVKQTN